MAELIKATDNLNEGRIKLNKAITDTEEALTTAKTADEIAKEAKTASESTQTQLDTIVIEGDSSVEAAQARVNNSGTAFPTLKQRLDAEHQEVTAQLQQTETISNKRFETSTYKITDDNTYTAWPQDKCFEMNGVLYALFNQGVAHNSTGLQPMMKASRDGGISWSSNKVIRSSPSKVTYPRGVTCWGAGSDGNIFYAVILYRGSSTTVGASKHTLIYGDPDDKAKNWTEIEINISKDGHVPNQYHSFVKLPDGSIAFGYNYLSGEVGIAKTFDRGVTWETHVLYTDAQMQNTLNLCEVTLTYDSVNDAVVGFMRAENKILDTPKFFISRHNCQTFEKHETNIDIDQTPFPITMVGDKYYAFYSERYGKAKAYLLEGVASEVLSQGFSAFKQTFLGFLNNYKSPSGTGVGSVVSFDGNLHIFYSAENKNSTVDVYQTIVNLKQDDEAILSSPIASAKIDDGQKTEIVLYNNVAQTIPATTATKLSYSQIGQDELLEYNPTDSSIIVKNSGIYMFEISVDLGTLTNAQSYLEVRINGSNAKRLAWVNTYNTASVTVLQGTYFQKMNAGTKIEFYVLTSNETTTRVGQPNNYLLAYQI